ncbi:MAG: hypothetical protein KJO69_09720, partial [Gammaproteobacteria bacterium]|nr:hypothetical protein [Gammaproteobacteria bacterium]NNJ72893.1 hypothetical protein [Enterobacterales bacterium]
MFSLNQLNAAACVDVFGSAVQTSGDTLVLPAFQFSTSNSDPNGSNLNLAAGDYDNVDVNNNGSITFTTVDGLYRLDQLDLGRNVTANFAPGDYFIDDLDFDRDVTLN